MSSKKLFRVALYLLLLGLCLPLMAQSEDVIQESQYLSKVVLCKDIEENEPILETTSFNVWDEKAVCWIRFNYQSQELFRITWEWIDPEGKIYHVGELEMEAGDYSNYRSWYWISIQDHTAANLLGAWKVRVYVDDIFLAMQDFKIE